MEEKKPRAGDTLDSIYEAFYDASIRKQLSAEDKSQQLPLLYSSGIVESNWINALLEVMSDLSGAACRI